MSEMLFTFLTLGVLYLISLIDMDHLFCKKRPRSQIIYFILMIIALNYIYFVRTMGTSIILAIIIYLAILCTQKLLTLLKSKRKNDEITIQATNKRALFSHLIILCAVIASFAGAKTAWDMRNKSIGVTSSDSVSYTHLILTFSISLFVTIYLISLYAGKYHPSPKSTQALKAG